MNPRRFPFGVSSNTMMDNNQYKAKKYADGKQINGTVLVFQSMKTILITRNYVILIDL